MPKVYLDYAAATPVDDDVLRVMKPYFFDTFYNPSAIYLSAKAVKNDIAMARAKVAILLGAKPSEIIFTAGGTEANNIAIRGIMDKFPKSEMLISSIEHESVREPAKDYTVNEIPVNKQGIANTDKLKKMITNTTALVSVMYANNEIGTIQPIQEISKIIDEVKKYRKKNGIKLPIYLHTDAAQAPVYLQLQTHKLGVDLMTLNGGKIYGPKQSGILFIKAGVNLQSVIKGGGQERGIRSGTENVPSIIGFTKALDIVTAKRSMQLKETQKLQEYFYSLIKEKLPGVIINGSVKHRLPNNIHITIPGTDNERILMELDERGVMCATGSACSASNDEPSHVLSAIGISEKDARSSLRFTLGNYTTKQDIEYTVDILTDICL